MSSTNVHSSEDKKQKYASGGEVAPTNEGTLIIPPETAKCGPAKLEVIEGLNAVIPAQSNETIKDGKKVVGRVLGGKVLSGITSKVKEALKKALKEQSER